MAMTSDAEYGFSEDNALGFSNLLQRALMEWPSVVDLSTLDYSLTAEPRYSVRGLGEFEEVISARYYGRADEILMRNLHYVIFVMLHKVAANCTQMRMADLRPESLKAYFEEWLNKSLKIDGWGNADIALVERYFSLNQKSS